MPAFWVFFRTCTSRFFGLSVPYRIYPPPRILFKNNFKLEIIIPGNFIKVKKGQSTAYKPKMIGREAKRHRFSRKIKNIEFMF